MNFVVSTLPDRIKIQEYRTLRNTQVADQKQFTKYDCADVRDFLIGSKAAGLVVRLPGGKIARAPYILPYVYPSSRVGLPAKVDESFSLAIWELNLKFFNSLNNSLLVKDSTLEFQELAYHLGFDPSDTLSNLCAWHLNKFNAFLINER
jgi:hypothetical protein